MTARAAVEAIVDQLPASARSSTRRTVAVVLLVDVDDTTLTNAALADLILARTGGRGHTTRPVALGIPYVEVHDDLDAVLDPATAARYRIGD